MRLHTLAYMIGFACLAHTSPLSAGASDSPHPILGASDTFNVRTGQFVVNDLDKPAHISKRPDVPSVISTTSTAASSPRRLRRTQAERLLDDSFSRFKGTYVKSHSALVGRGNRYSFHVDVDPEGNDPYANLVYEVDAFGFNGIEWERLNDNRYWNVKVTTSPFGGFGLLVFDAPASATVYFGVTVSKSGASGRMWLVPEYSEQE